MLEQLDEFKISLQPDFKPETIASYAREIERFAEFIIDRQGGRGWGEVSADDIEAYLHAKETGNADQNRTLSSLRKWYIFLYSSQRSSASVPYRVPRRKETLSRRRGLSESELVQLVSSNNRRGVSSFRNIRLLIFLYGTGLRTSEVLGLRMRDLWTEEEIKAAAEWASPLKVGDTITVRSRADDMQTLYLSEVAKISLGSWLQRAEQAKLLARNKLEGHIWVNTQGDQWGKPMTGQVLRDVLRRLGEAAFKGEDWDKTKVLTPRLLRQTFEDHLMFAGVDKDIRAHILGRKELGMERYIFASRDELLSSSTDRLPNPWR